MSNSNDQNQPLSFPVISTKRPGITAKFDLNTPTGRREYFEAKAGNQIEEIKEYLDKSTFLGIMLAKKSAGKGTYSKMVQELLGEDRVEVISVGDLTREVAAQMESDPAKRDEIVEALKSRYRGYISFENALEAYLGRDQQTLVPTEFILAMIQMKIEQIPEKAIFLDGFPRDLDQISYSLYIRQIMNLRDDPDFFVLIDVPENVIEARMLTRVICPDCHTSRNTVLLPTQFVEYDKGQDAYIMKCDNPSCSGHGKTVLVEKAGDKDGIAPIRKRLDRDGELIQKALSLHGIPKITLRNSIPVSEVSKFEDYEITPRYDFSHDETTGEVKTSESPWVIKDDAGIDSHSLIAAPVVLSLVEQLHKILLG